MAVISPISSTSSTSAVSAVEKAEQAKQKGNDHFKNGRYAESIGFYSEAHILVPSSPIYPLNRAQAYIKLEKFTDAERDCTTSLAIDVKQTKPYFRRATARRALGKNKEARQDFATVVRLDPKMAAAVQVELAKMDADDKKTAAATKGGKNQPRSSAPSPSPPPPSQPTSYPIPIKMVYPKQPNSAAAPFSTPIPAPIAPSPPPTSLFSSRSASKPDPTASIFPTAPKPKPQAPSSSAAAASFAALKSAREAKAVAVVSPPPAPQTASPSVKSHPRPTSAHALHKTLVAIGSPKDAFDFLLTIPPSSLPFIIGSSLEPALFDLLLSALEAAPSSSRQVRREVVQALEGTQRVRMVRMMTERGEERWDAVSR